MSLIQLRILPCLLNCDPCRKMTYRENTSEYALWKKRKARCLWHSLAVLRTHRFPPQMATQDKEWKFESFSTADARTHPFFFTVNRNPRKRLESLTFTLESMHDAQQVANACLHVVALGSSYPTWDELKIVHKKNLDSFSKGVEGAPQECYVVPAHIVSGLLTVLKGLKSTWDISKLRMLWATPAMSYIRGNLMTTNYSLEFAT